MKNIKKKKFKLNTIFLKDEIILTALLKKDIS